jgi:putative endonuclease
VAWFVYMVRCADGSLYTGATNDLERRVARHNEGTGARYTRSRRPVALVWSHRAKDRGSALSREARLKRLSREEKLAVVEGRLRQLPPRR